MFFLIRFKELSIRVNILFFFVSDECTDIIENENLAVQHPMGKSSNQSRYL